MTIESMHWDSNEKNKQKKKLQSILKIKYPKFPIKRLTYISLTGFFLALSGLKASSSIHHEQTTAKTTITQHYAILSYLLSFLFTVRWFGATFFFGFFTHFGKADPIRHPEWSSLFQHPLGPTRTRQRSPLNLR